MIIAITIVAITTHPQTAETSLAVLLKIMSCMYHVFFVVHFNGTFFLFI